MCETITIQFESTWYTAQAFSDSSVFLQKVYLQCIFQIQYSSAVYAYIYKYQKHTSIYVST